MNWVLWKYIQINRGKTPEIDGNVCKSEDHDRHSLGDKWKHKLNLLEVGQVGGVSKKFGRRREKCKFGDPFEIHLLNSGWYSCRCSLHNLLLHFRQFGKHFIFRLLISSLYSCSLEINVFLGSHSWIKTIKPWELCKKIYRMTSEQVTFHYFLIIIGVEWTMRTFKEPLAKMNLIDVQLTLRIMHLHCTAFRLFIFFNLTIFIHIVHVRTCFCTEYLGL